MSKNEIPKPKHKYHHQRRISLFVGALSASRSHISSASPATTPQPEPNIEKQIYRAVVQQWHFIDIRFTLTPLLFTKLATLLQTNPFRVSATKKILNKKRKNSARGKMELCVSRQIAKLIQFQFYLFIYAFLFILYSIH